LKCKTSFLYTILTVLLCLSSAKGLSAQDTTEETEVYLDFQYQGVVKSVVISYYKNDVFFLPVTELFSLFKVQNSREGNIITGKFSTDQTPFRIDLAKQTIKFGNKQFSLSTDDFLIQELDDYLSPGVFSEIFKLNFSVDFNKLILNLETEATLPVVEEALRNRRRKVVEANTYQKNYYDLALDRNKSFLNGGFVDYSLTSFITNNENSYSYSTSLGLQLAGGDLQGNVFGNYTNNFNISSNNLRWRYVVRNNPAITQVYVGQSTLDGVLSSNFTGLKISNQPIEPRRYFDEYVVQGSTIPESEVELYLNNALIGYEKSDELGNYRFTTPLYYGTSDLDLKIYGPTGETIDKSTKIQVPFSFSPQGEFNYNLNAGVLDNPLLGSTERPLVVNAKATYGIKSWLSGSLGTEYFEGAMENSTPALTGAISTRFLTSYILTLEGVSQGYYRSNLNAFFANSANFSIDFTKYTSESILYNSSGRDKQLNTSFFYPFTVGNLPLISRVSSFTVFRDDVQSTSLRLDLSTRINKFNFRLGYSDRILNSYNFLDPSFSSTLDNSITYNISRNPNIPKILRGTFLRAQMRYLPKLSKIETAQFVISRNLFNSGRLQLSYGRNFINNFNNVRASFVIDFNKARSNSTFSSIRSDYSVSQNIRGSLGYDTNYNNFIVTSRNQVGRSGAAIKLFVDNNNNERYDEDIDQPIDAGSIRIDRTSASLFRKNGILYYSQMQPYFRYNMQVNKGSIENPLLVPELNEFSIITDPNTFKKIEIPFYMSGVIEGSVNKYFDEQNNSGIGGVRVLISGIDSDFFKELRSFSDGSFYSYEVPPGKYKMSIDQNQLSVLDSRSEPGEIEFEVQALSEGDFVEGLSFLIVPNDYDPDQKEVKPAEVIIADISETTEMVELEEELDDNITKTLRLIIQAQTAFYSRDIERALTLVNESLSLFETAQGYALKGSLNYLKGNKDEAQENWDRALEFNPDILIPDIEVLDQLIRTQPGN